VTLAKKNGVTNVNGSGDDDEPGPEPNGHAGSSGLNGGNTAALDSEEEVDWPTAFAPAKDDLPGASEYIAKLWDEL
jgi:hypothetical protein